MSYIEGRPELLSATFGKVVAHAAGQARMFFEAGRDGYNGAVNARLIEQDKIYRTEVLPREIRLGIGRLVRRGM